MKRLKRYIVFRKMCDKKALVINVTIHTVLFTVTVRAEVFRQKAQKNNILRKSWTG